MRLYIALVHYPVCNKKRQRIASAITTFDLHDIARLARTYDVTRFFVVTPLVDQQRLAERIIMHWTEGHGARYNRDRKEAISLVSVVTSLQEAISAVTRQEGRDPIVIATDAAERKEKSISYDRVRDLIEEEKSLLLLFGTAWGLEREVLDESDYVLAPVTGKTGYNHLSVRSAAAIILDRLAGR